MFVRSIWRPMLAALALAMAIAPARARAQETPSEQPTDAAAREKSRAAFRRGVIHLRAQEWPAARSSFEEAWTLFPHPSILLNLGIAHLKTDDPVLAEQDFVRFLSEDPGAPPDEVSSARDGLAEARSKIGTVRVVVTPQAARVVVDRNPVAVRTRASNEGVAEARLRAGKHTVQVEAEGFHPKMTEIELPAKSDTEVRVTLVRASGPKPRPAEPVHSPTRTIAGWSLAGVSALSLGASGFMGFRAISLADEYGDRGSPSFQNHDVKDEGLTFRTGADIALLTALVSGAAAAVLLLTDIGVSGRTDAAGRVPSRIGNRVQQRESSLLRW